MCDYVRGLVSSGSKLDQNICPFISRYATVYWYHLETTEIVSEYDQEILKHKLQTNPRHCENEPHNNHETPERQTIKATGSLFPIKMIARLEWTKSNTQQNIEQLQNPTMGVKSTTIQQQQNFRLRTDSKMHFTDTKS